MSLDMALNDRRRSPRKTEADVTAGTDVMLIINHVDKRLGELETRLMNVIREGREAHTREHIEQQSICQHSMAPLQADYARRENADIRRDARVAPVVRVAVWVSNHWVVSLAIAAAGLWLLHWAGVLQ
jgi:hypothetical protein